MVVTDLLPININGIMYSQSHGCTGVAGLNTADVRPYKQVCLFIAIYVRNTNLDLIYLV